MEVTTMDCKLVKVGRWYIVVLIEDFGGCPTESWARFVLCAFSRLTVKPFAPTVHTNHVKIFHDVFFAFYHFLQGGFVKFAEITACTAIGHAFPFRVFSSFGTDGECAFSETADGRRGLSLRFEDEEARRNFRHSAGVTKEGGCIGVISASGQDLVSFFALVFTVVWF